MMIDISQGVFTCKVFPGDPAPHRERVREIERGDRCNLTAFSMCAHNGTHVDAPSHFLKDGKTLDEMELDCFVGDCYVGRCEGDITAEDALRILEEARAAGAKKRILIAGRATVTAEAARVFAEARLNLGGCEGAPVRAILIQ